MLQQAIGLSIILGFLSSEFFGLYAGGLITSGYLAFYVEQPYRIATTILLSVVTYFLTKLLQRFIIIYGRRRFMVTVIISLILTWVIEQCYYYVAIPQDLRIIGYIIPGLLANDMLRQGIPKTLIMTLLFAFVIRLLLMVGL